jgi:hypothetical protein
MIRIRPVVPQSITITNIVFVHAGNCVVDVPVFDIRHYLGLDSIDGGVSRPVRGGIKDHVPIRTPASVVVCVAMSGLSRASTVLFGTGVGV